MTAVFRPAAVAAKRKWSARKPTCNNQNIFRLSWIVVKSKHTPVDSSNRGVGYSQGPAANQDFNCFFLHRIFYLEKAKYCEQKAGDYSPERGKPA